MSLATLTACIAGIVQLPLLAVWLVLSGYLVFLTASAGLGRVRRRAPVPAAAPTTRFSILVPAHDEALVLGPCLTSLTSFDYPAALRRVIVIADNCTDATASIARASGVTVYERHDAERRGKGYALNWAMPRLLGGDAGWTDAVVIFDADTLADAAFLRHLDSRLRRGSLALQGRYDLLNPFHNWRTALLYCALLLFNRVRTLARDTWGWTNLLKGNGMCFARAVVDRFGWNAYSLAEDIEFTTTLLHAGIRVDAVGEAILYAQAPQTAGQADSPRMRWEGGRVALARRDGLRLLRDALRERSPAKLDWALDLLMPPLAILVGVPGILLLGNVLLMLLAGAPAHVGVAWALALFGIGCYVVAGLGIGGADPRAYLYLLATPLLLVWKLRIYALMLLGRGARGWVRTERTRIRPAD
ncbi:MAG TPA: glycosyltransferase family 2 protein [Chloroflexia bacterium]|nr:glycosyltransferase family 2 protein [Chloroflexia bacterium]